MKKIAFSVAFLLLVLLSEAQTVGFCLAPICGQTLQMPIKTDTIAAKLTVLDSTKSITWSQVSGPNTLIMGVPILNPNGTAQLTSVLPLSNFIAGNYVFRATGVSSRGNTGIATVAITVLPPLPTPTKTIKSILITYSDGTTQTLP